MPGIRQSCVDRRSSSIRRLVSTGLCRHTDINHRPQQRCRVRLTRMAIRNSLLVRISLLSWMELMFVFVAHSMYPSMPAESYPSAPGAPPQHVNQYHPESSAPPLHYGSPPQSDPNRLGAAAHEQSQPLMANQASAVAHDTGRQPSHTQLYPPPGSPQPAYNTPHPPIPQEASQHPSHPPQPSSNTAYQAIPHQETGQQYAEPTFPAFPDAPTQIMQPSAPLSPEQPKEALLIEL